ncbi:MAG: hypothetical protein EOO41_04995, partial [Methanobacteriota archaeon]
MPDELLFAVLQVILLLPQRALLACAPPQLLAACRVVLQRGAYHAHYGALAVSALTRISALLPHALDEWGSTLLPLVGTMLEASRSQQDTSTMLLDNSTAGHSVTAFADDGDDEEAALTRESVQDEASFARLAEKLASFTAAALTKQPTPAVAQVLHRALTLAADAGGTLRVAASSTASHTFACGALLTVAPFSIQDDLSLLLHAADTVAGTGDSVPAATTLALAKLFALADHAVSIHALLTRLVMFVGRLSHAARHVTGDAALHLQDELAWSVALRDAALAGDVCVPMELPGCTAFDLSLRHMLPHISKLATSSPHRRTKIGACELLHAAVTVLLGNGFRTAAAHAGAAAPAPHTAADDLTARLLQVCMDLAVDVDPA